MLFDRDAELKRFLFDRIEFATRWIGGAIDRDYSAPLLASFSSDFSANAAWPTRIIRMVYILPGAVGKIIPPL